MYLNSLCCPDTVCKLSYMNKYEFVLLHVILYSMCILSALMGEAKRKFPIGEQ